VIATSEYLYVYSINEGEICAKIKLTIGGVKLTLDQSGLYAAIISLSKV
jgi:hypothetical protein